MGVNTGIFGECAKNPTLKARSGDSGVVDGVLRITVPKVVLDEPKVIGFTTAENQSQRISLLSLVARGFDSHSPDDFSVRNLLVAF